jgi:hypothetical protein
MQFMEDRTGSRVLVAPPAERGYPLAKVTLNVLCVYELDNGSDINRLTPALWQGGVNNDPIWVDWI